MTTLLSHFFSSLMNKLYVLTGRPRLQTTQSLCRDPLVSRLPNLLAVIISICKRQMTFDHVECAGLL
ncbi:unnamed protein product [Bursaphelenchus xylophilus]|uniref:(pine wood nematode) hypothetical protein n=1 Tax=Bursaphelenchus xylophilus TaxID=6326 RepID=A0A7I8XDE1_BURXY|nr:unnamed protein product [Bursaphelenchus xylophilus]CAG9113953.1 unnamed protein product [Bursaphelenchus xylophilus]